MIRTPTCYLLLYLFAGSIFAAAPTRPGVDSKDESLRTWHSGAGAKPCAKIPNCLTQQVLSYTATGWQCVTIPSCARGYALTHKTGTFRCITIQDPS